MVAARVAAVATVTFFVASLIVVIVSDAKLSAAGHPDLRQAAGSGIVFATTAVISAVVGVTLLVRRPLHPVGWLFAALATTFAMRCGDVGVRRVRALRASRWSARG